MKAIVIVLHLTLLAYCVALPVKPEDNVDPLVGIPILVQEPSTLENEPSGDSPIVAYAILLSKLKGGEKRYDGTVLEKRNAKERDQEDLETAAGTYALRPLFVYRQQLAYRQRTRDAYRRRNRF